MFQEPLVLHFETAPGRHPDTAIAARALLDWAELVQQTLAVISPGEQIALEIIGVREGSTRFPNMLKFLDEQAGNVKVAWAEYPHLKKMVAGAAHTFYTSLVAAGVTLALQPEEQTVRFSDRDRAAWEAMTSKAASAPQVKAASQRFYRTMESDTRIEGVGVATDWQEKPSLIIPRSEFPERSGLWTMQEEAAAERPQHVTWDVVLLRPALISKPQAWQFMRDGFKFSAQMADALFLQAMKEGRVPLTLQEGVIMRVEVEYKEVLTGQVWEPIPRTRKIVRVLSPTPLAQPSPDSPRHH